MIKILKMTQDGFDHYMLSAIKNYANEKVNNGTWESKDALSNSCTAASRRASNC